jgi:hypothetical protein
MRKELRKSITLFSNSIFSTDQIKELNNQVKVYIAYTKCVDQLNVLHFLDAMEIKQLYIFVKFLNSNNVDSEHLGEIEPAFFKKYIQIAENRLKWKIKHNDTITANIIKNVEAEKDSINSTSTASRRRHRRV